MNEEWTTLAVLETQQAVYEAQMEQKLAKLGKLLSEPELSLTKRVSLLEQQLAKREKQIVMLWETVAWYADEARAISKNMLAKQDIAVMASVQVLSLDAGSRAEKALATINDLADCILCDAKPVVWCEGKDLDAVHAFGFKTIMVDDEKRGVSEIPLYARRKK
jgi:hypothetical protein